MHAILTKRIIQLTREHLQIQVEIVIPLISKLHYPPLIHSLDKIESKYINYFILLSIHNECTQLYLYYSRYRYIMI